MIYIIAIIGVIIAGIVAESVAGGRMSRAMGCLASGSVVAVVAYWLSVSLYTGVHSAVETIPYIGSLGITLGFDISQTSLVLVTLAAIVTFAAVIGGNPENYRRKASNILLLLFELSAIGIFTSANLFMFFIFWDVGVIAAFFMISHLGSGGHKSSAKNYLIYSLFASAMLLFSIILVYTYVSPHSFSIQAIESAGATIPVHIQQLIFISMLIAFMVKMPIFPLHSWMADAYSDASTQGSMAIAGILSKFGAYGMLLLFLMIPISHKYILYVLVLAMISAFYAVFNAMRNSDMKRMAAYTSMVESALILVGIVSINIIGNDGAVYAMLGYGSIMALMFLSIGSLDFAFGTRDLNELKGAVRNAASSVYSFLISVFSATGVPLTAGFIADILIFLGAYRTFGLLGLVPISTIVIMGGYLYYAVNRSLLSTTITSKVIRLREGHWNPAYVVLITAIFLFGVFPSILLGFGVI